MAEYGSGIFYGRTNSHQISSNFSQLGLLSLPSELDIGVPITASALKYDVEAPKDIILLAEFSEIEGPIPLLSIPQNNNVQDIDLNDFVVQLMSTDYQNMGSSYFQIYKDTCLLQEDAEKGHYTYVHYFTLYDVRARGFVRPMCLAYISRESEKLKKYFKSIQKEFSEATEYLRVCNLEFFSKEMRARIEDLHFTKERFIQSQKYFPGGDAKSTPVKFENLKEKKSFMRTKRKRAISFSAGVLQSPTSVILYGRNSFDKSFSRQEGDSLNNGDDSDKENSVEKSASLSPTDTRFFKQRFPASRSMGVLSSSLPHNSTFGKCADTHSAINTVSPTDTHSAINTVSPTDTHKLASRIRSQFRPYFSPTSSSQSETTPKESPREFILEGLSHSSDSSSSTVKSVKDSKPTREGVQMSSLMHDYSLSEETSNSEEMSVLQHTSLDALAVQLLDCQYILEVINNYLDCSETGKEINQFLDEIKCKPQSPLYIGMEELGLLKPHNDQSEPRKEPSIFVISLIRRNFKNMRTVRSLCSIGYIACIAKLLDVYQKFSKPTLTLVFEDLDRDLYKNPFCSLFVGNIPIISVGSERESPVSIPRLEKFSLDNFCWNEDLVRLLYVDLSKATTPDSEYVDAKDSFDQDNIMVADDCLEVFTRGSSSNSETEKKSASSNSEVSELEFRNSEAECEKFQSVKSSAVSIKDASHPSTPQRSTSSDSSWASSTPRDLNLMEGMENELEEEGEEEVVSDVTDKTSIKMIQNHIDKRMEMGKLHHMSAVIQQFGGVSQCIVHSILSGKPMIVAGPEYLKSVVVLYTKTLSTILPVKPNEFLPVLKWHTGTITPHHLKMHKIIGICIPERLHVQDLMSNSTLNQVTVLNIETGHISGVAYSGNLLYKADQLSRRHFRSDLSLQAALQSILISLGMKVFLHFHLLRTTSRTSSEILKGIGVSRGDWLMVQYLSKMIEEQMTENLRV